MLHGSRYFGRAVAALSAALVAAALLTGCGGSDSGDPGASTPPPVVPTAPTLTAQPGDAQVTAGGAARFSVSVASDGGAAASYQWQRSNDNGATWAAIAGATADSYTLAAPVSSDNGSQFRAVVSRGNASTTSSTATLRVAAAISPAQITVQPVAQSVVAGAAANFAVTATGTSLAYRWQSSSDGNTWADLTGASAANLQFATTTLAQNGQQVRVVVSNSTGSVTSTAAVLNVTTVAGGNGVLPVVASRLSASYEGSYVLGQRGDGAVLVWGSGMVGGTGPLLPGTAARVISGVATAAGVHAGKERSLVVIASGGLMGWGRNWRGALGVTSTDDNLVVDQAVSVSQVSNVVQAQSCLDTTYALRSDGALLLMPSTRALDGRSNARTVAGVPPLTSLVLVRETGLSGSGCGAQALDRDGNVWRVVARETDFGNWQTFVTQDPVAPPATQLLACNAVDISADFGGYCLAKTRDGRLWGWGENGRGQLGLGDRIGRVTPTQLPHIAGVKKLLVSILSGSFALTENGDLHGWGEGGLLAGRTGFTDVNFSDFWSPGLIPSISNIEDLTTGDYGRFVTVLKRDGSIWTWGSNDSGVFANGTAGGESALPVRAPGLTLN